MWLIVKQKPFDRIYKQAVPKHGIPVAEIASSCHATVNIESHQGIHWMPDSQPSQ